MDHTLRPDRGERADGIVEDAQGGSLVREGPSGGVAASVLAALADHPRHVFWPDDIPYQQVDIRAVMGHRQVSDAYLASLARVHRGRLATFDRGLVATHPDIAGPVPGG